MTNSDWFAVMIGPAIVASVCILLLATCWKRMTVGQQIYASCLSLLAIGLSHVAPYHDPENNRIHWGPVWRPPHYADATMSELLTAEMVKSLKSTGEISVSPDFVQNSVSKRMRLHRATYAKAGFLFLIIGMGGWFVIPTLLDRLFFGTRPKDSKGSLKRAT